ncbi:MAG TPA: GAF domain-containing protein [Solirubrobacterales bacterium]|jgi:signal transduction histidine kinase|nr:GAF domain-containing protein [Solirubrobacterales bacterium]
MGGDALAEHRLTRLIEVGRTLVSELDLEIVLRRLLEVARELTGARYAALGILDEDRHELERFITLGIAEERRREIGNLPRGHGVLGLLIDDPKPLRLDDVGGHPRSYGFPPGHPPMKTFLGVPVMIRGEAYGNLYLTEKMGGPFDEADEQSVVTLAGWAAIAIENARLYGDAERRRAELEHAVRSLEATTEIARAVGGETDLGRVLETIAKRARALIEARSLVILLEERGTLVAVATAGELERDVRGRRIAIEGSTTGQVLRSLRAERVADVSARLRISPAELGIGAEAAMLVPLAFRGRPLGLIAGFDRIADGPEFSTEDERLLLAFAASAATAVATAQSVSEDRIKHSIQASEHERGRWARELHDETLQALGAMRVALSSALRGGGDTLERAVRDAVGQLGQEIDKVRALITELRPAALDEIGLAPAIEALAIHVEKTQGVDVVADIDLVDGAGRLEPELENAIYRLVQEALTNVAKHARAEQVRLRVAELETGDSIEIEVADDGVGFDPEARSEGFGIVGMRERAELAGGWIEITSSPGSGTILRATLPGLPGTSAERGAA